MADKPKKKRENCSEHVKMRKESNQNNENSRNLKMTRTQTICVGKRYDAHLETKWAKKLILVSQFNKP